MNPPIVGTDRIELSRHAALKRRVDGDVLVLPEQAIRIRGSGGEIVRLCEGGETAQAVISAMQARYPDEQKIETEVIRFLAEMIDLGGLCRTSLERTEVREDIGRKASE